MLANFTRTPRGPGPAPRPAGHIDEFMSGPVAASEQEEDQEEGDAFSLDVDMDVDLGVDIDPTGNDNINSSPLTAMETGELIQGELGSTPLEVKDRVAVTEESVELHVPGIITQF